MLCRVLGPVLVSGVLAAALGHPTPAAAQPVLSFDETRAYPVAANAKGFSSNDCDGDGFVDIIAAGQHADALTTLINDQTGVFTYGETVPVGSQPSGAACGDFNADGLIDVAALSRDLGTVSIYHRQESGGFALAGSRPAGFLPSALTPGHLNSDGFMDLVAVGSKSNDVTVLLSTGSGGLPPSASYRVPMDSPHSATIADFNLDGIPDIAVAGSGDPFVSILFGDGIGFAPNPEGFPSPFQETRRPNHSRGIASGDLNNDGSPDLVVLAANSSIHLYLGDGAGSFTKLTELPGPAGGEAIVLEDFDGDGLQDIGYLSSSTNSVQILFAEGPGIFPVLTSTVITQQALNGFGAIAARTVLLDPLDPESTQLQLLTVDNSRASASLQVVEQADLSSLSITSLQPLDSGPLGLRLGDINGDEIPDALINRKGRRKTFPIQIMFGNENGGFSSLTGTPGGTCGNDILEGEEFCDDGNTKNRDGCSKACVPEVKGQVTSVDVAHLDDDEHSDLVVVDKSGRLTVLLGDGTGRFLDVRPITKVKRKTGALVADFNSDGFTDIVIVPKSKRTGALQLLVNDGFGEFVPVAISGEQPRGSLLGGDVDGNGFPDVIGATRKGWTIFFNDGLGPVRSSGELSGPRKPLGFAAADFDEDGFVDVIGTYKASRRTPAAVIFRGGPDGAFGSGAPLDLPGASGRAYVVDLDQDLHQDIVTCEDESRPLCLAFYGNGKAEFGAAAVADGTFIGRDVRGAGVADFDGDGTVDLVGISRRDNRGKIMFRHADRALRTQTALVTGQKPAALAVVDLDDNGRADIIVANEGSNDLSIFMSNEGSRSYPVPAPVRLPVGGLGAPALAVGDINDDTRPDLAVTQAGSDTVTPFLNLGGPIVNLGPITTGDEPRGVALGNLNGDNTLDIATANRGDNTFTILLSQPDGSYARTDYPSGGQRPSAIAIADLDDDGFKDIIVTNEKIQDEFKTGNLVVFLNTAGDGTFSTPASTHVRGRATPRAICVGDFDDDDTPDVAVASIDSNDVMVLHGDGSGGWRADERAFPVGQQAVSVWCYDADGDGRTDVSYGRRNAGDVGAILTGEE